MKIANTTPSMVNQAYTTSSAATTQAARTAPEKKTESAAMDSVTLSASAKDLNMVKLAMDSEPEPRSQKIQELKNTIAQGGYTVDPDALADTILASFGFHEIA